MHGAGYRRVVPDQDRPRTPVLPEELHGLTYDQATPEQIAQIRAYWRARLAALDARWTPEEREQRREEFRRRVGILGVMAHPEHDAPEDAAALLAAVGIQVTDAGKARARARLAEADAQRTPERRAAWRAQAGLPPAEAA